MKIITLIENHVNKAGLIAEHGLSFYIETDHKKILFDTGQSGAFIANAITLGIDITEIDCVIVSHGHMDHTGGLTDFLQLNKKATIYGKKEAFLPKFHGPKKEIGIKLDTVLYGNRICFVEEKTEIDKGFWIVPDIPIVNKTDTAFHNFQVLKNKVLLDDNFEDELFVCIIKNNKLSVISSCSHRGITNMVQVAISHFQNSPLNKIIGGFHLKDENQSQYPTIVEFFNKTKPESIWTCHCTGIEMFAELKKDCHSSMVFYNFTGNQINF